MHYIFTTDACLIINSCNSWFENFSPPKLLRHFLLGRGFKSLRSQGGREFRSFYSCNSWFINSSPPKLLRPYLLGHGFKSLRSQGVKEFAAPIRVIRG